MKYIGIPYKVKGRTMDAIDCYGLVIKFYEDIFNIHLPDYGRSIDDNPDAVSRTVIDSRGEWTRVENPQFGDVAIFNIAGKPIHIGLFIGGDDFLHCLHGRNSCIENLQNLSWKRRLDGFYRWSK